MSTYDHFLERLESALESEEGREDFLDYLQGLSKGQRAELLTEADCRDPEGASGRAGEEIDPPPAVRLPEDPSN